MTIELQEAEVNIISKKDSIKKTNIILFACDKDKLNDGDDVEIFGWGDMSVKMNIFATAPHEDPKKLHYYGKLFDKW